MASILLAMALVGAGIIFRSEVGDVAGGVFGAIGDWSTRLRDLAAAEPATEVGLRSREGESASVLVTLGETEGEAAFALLVADPEGPPLLVLLPQDLLVNVPGFGEFRLIDAVTFDGPELAGLAITNQFGIRIDAIASLPAGAIERGLTGPVEVDVPVALFEESEEGVTRTIAAETGTLRPALVERLLVAHGEGDLFDWLQRQGAAWESVLAATATEPRVADRITAEGGPGGAAAADLLVTIAGDEETVIATVPVSRAESSTGLTALIPSPDQISRFVSDRLGHLLIRPEGRPRIEILNGNGRIGTTAPVAATLVRAGFYLIKTDNADGFDYDDTLIIAQGEDAEEAAREVLDLLGRGLLLLEARAPSGVVDLSIIVGHDLPAGEG